MSNQVNTASHPKAKNPFVEALHNLKKNKMACVGGIILLLFILISRRGACLWLWMSCVLSARQRRHSS